MPYRIDVRSAADDLIDRLIELGAIDAELATDGSVAALMPDGVRPEQVARALGVDEVAVTPGVGRDEDSVWVLGPRPVTIGRVRIAPAHSRPEPGVLRLIDGRAFGTGLHPTTALCLEALQDIVDAGIPDAVLDVGTGSGVLALAALMLGVPRALGVDLDEEALHVAAENASLNGMDDRFELRRGGPEIVDGAWPLVLANVLAAPLIEMAPAVVRRLGQRGELVLSGIARSVEADVDRAYRRLGLVRARVLSRSGWLAVVMRASW